MAGVKCVLRDAKEKGWFDAGGLELRGRDVPELKKQMKQCANICRSFHNGKLYFCPRASFGTKLGIPDYQGGFVDFTKPCRKKVLRMNIYQLNQKKYLEACNYCDEGTERHIPIPVAEQLSFDLHQDEERS